MIAQRTCGRLRLAAALIATGLFLGGVALGLGTNLPRVSSNAAAARSLAPVRDRLRKLRAMRGDADLSGERFDALIGSLAAGIGVDTPRELEPWIESIAIARDHERRLNATPDTGPNARLAVEQGLAGAEVALQALAEARATAIASGIHQFAAGLGMAALLAAGIGAGMLLRTCRRLWRERSTIAGLLGCDPEDHREGALANAVALLVIAARTRQKQTSQPSHMRSASPAREPTPGRAALVEIAPLREDL